VGQRAFFTVDSYPDKQFKGVVSEVQLNPVVTNNVVTYNVIMEVTNETRNTYLPPTESGAPKGPAKAIPAPPAGRGHRPELASSQTGTIEYTTARYMPPGSPVYNGNLALFPGMTANCTIVTNRKDGVLRVPSAALRFNPAAFVPVEEKKPAASGPRPAVTAGTGGLGRGVMTRTDDRLWVLANGKPKQLPVRAGVSDGSFTEVTGDGVVAGLVVLSGIDDYKKAPAQGSGSPLGGPGGMRH
jgi:HlyD family secretion protein